MAWTYAGMPFLDPPTTQSYIDSVRFLVGDTDTTDQQLQDGEIIGLLTQNATSTSNGFTTPPGSVTTFPVVGQSYSVYEAAIMACTTLAAKYSRRVAMTVGDLSKSAGDMAKHYIELRKTLRVDAQRHNTPKPYAGGLLKSELENDETNDDLNTPQFSIGMDDNPDGTPSVLGGTTGFSQAVPAG